MVGKNTVVGQLTDGKETFKKIYKALLEDKNNIQNAYDNSQQALNATTYITNTISVLSNSVSQFSRDVDNFKTEISDLEKVTNNSLKELESKINIIIDDVTNTKYKIGINDGHLYIQEFVEEATV